MALITDHPPCSGGFCRFSAPDLKKLPSRPVDFTKPTDKVQHDKMVSLVDQMLAAQKQPAGARSDADQDFCGNKCAGLDRQIDALVYALYALTPDEIKIVERAGDRIRAGAALHWNR